MFVRIPKDEPRTFEQLEEHYLIEKRLAERLRNARKPERRSLYAELYDELFRLVPLHPQLTLNAAARGRSKLTSERMKLLHPLLSRESTFLEVGPGDCALAIELCKEAKKVYAVEVSRTVTAGLNFPENFELVISDGCSVPVPPGTVDVAYSDQLMEHLHPDDAIEQLQNIFAALKPGGTYVCITPNRLSGPHDISRYFDKVATGFHLKEYTATELTRIFEGVGFVEIQVPGQNGESFKSKRSLEFLEDLLAPLPRIMRRWILGRECLASISNITLAATKQKEQ
jgi:SAM-dependent methyltransferase